MTTVEAEQWQREAAEGDPFPEQEGAPALRPGLPSLEYIRGYLLARGPELGSTLIDPTLRGWLDLLLDEAQMLREAMADMQFDQRRIKRMGLSQTEVTVYRYLRNTLMPIGEIAAALHVSPNTIKTHTKHIYEKLGTHARSELRQHPAL